MRDIDVIHADDDDHVFLSVVRLTLSRSQSRTEWIYRIYGRQKKSQISNLMSCNDILWVRECRSPRPPAPGRLWHRLQCIILRNEVISLSLSISFSLLSSLHVIRVRHATLRCCHSWEIVAVWIIHAAHRAIVGVNYLIPNLYKINENIPL